MNRVLHSKNVSQAVAAAGICALACACATSTLSLKSSPSQADVYVESVGGQAPRLVGQTPLVLTSDQIREKFSGSGPVTIELRKKGFEEVKTIITDLSASDIQMNVELPPELTFEDINLLNDSVDLVFEAQRLARAGRFEDALAKIRDVQNQFPQIAASYEIEGGIYYLQKDYRKSLDAYRTVVKMNPRNASAIRMRDMLEAKIGQSVAEQTSGQVPADGGGTR